MKNLFFLFALMTSAFIFAQKPIFTTAKINSATVYSNSAELSQTASVQLPKGSSEIVFKNVSSYLNESSIQVGAPANVTVLSVQFSTDYISEYDLDEGNPDIKKVRDSISWIQKEIQKIGIQKVSNTKTIELLDKNQQVSGVNSGLNMADMMKMVDYYNLKRTEISNTLVSLDEKEKKLNQQLASLNDKLQINTKNEEKISKGKLIIQVMNEIAGKTNFELSYLSYLASWVPFYELRTNSTNEPMQLLYKAKVTQNTGLDWKNVKLTLSSGNPNQNNQAPTVNTWFLRNKDVFNQNLSKYESAQLDEVVVVGYGTMKRKDTKSVNASISNYTTISENQLNVSFDIDIPYDILSNDKAHSVALKELQIPATFKYYAAPRIENEAFLMANITDYSKYNLLKGEANIIFENMYVGKTEINPSQTSDTLSLSMGRDKKIAIKRTKVEDKSGTKFFSSKKEQTFTFDIEVRNNKKENALLVLKDQYPISQDKEVEIELLLSEGAKVNKETGILSWDLVLNPNETKKFRISYKVKYPKDKFFENL